MPTIFRRKLLKIGDSVGITIPHCILETYNLEKGTTIKVISDATEHDGFIIIDLKGRSVDEIWKIIKE